MRDVRTIASNREFRAVRLGIQAIREGRLSDERSGGTHGRDVALAFALVVSAPGASAAAAHQILARVDGQPILAWDAEHFVSAEADGRDPPKPGKSGAPAATCKQLKRRNEQKLEDLIDRRLLLAECRRTGRRASDAEVLFHWRPIPRDPTESEIDATRERLCLNRLLAAEATAPIRPAEARVERSMRAGGPAVMRARIVDRLRVHAKITSGP